MKQLFLISLLSLCLTSFGHAKPQFTSIFSFGDSLADTGNLLALGKLGVPITVFSGFFPYGITFFRHPTGRYSDGRLILDFIAMELDLPFVPPYLAHNGSFYQGANFAVAGATGLDFAFFVENNITSNFLLNTSLNIQLGWFEQLKPFLCKTSEECREYFSKSLFFVGEFGLNDYTDAIFAGKSLAQVKAFVPEIVETISKATVRLISEGAKTLVLPGVAPFGCIPGILTLFPSANKADYEPKTGCLKKFNDLSTYENSLLSKEVNRLRCKYPHVTFIHTDYYRPIIELIETPERFGFAKTPLKVCCGVGGKYNYNISDVCGMQGVNSCQNPSIYLNWDGFHLTEAAYYHIATGWLKGPYSDPPILGVPSQ